MPAASPSRRSRAASHLLIAALCAILGFGIIVQVQRISDGDSLATARPQDLVVILDGLQRRSADLTSEIAELQATLTTLKSGGATSAAALAEAQRRAQTLAILAGTATAVGPGVQMTIADPGSAIPPEVLLAALQELRNAGAEAVQVGAVRVGVDSAFTGTNGQISLDGVQLTAPYKIMAIGDPPTLTAAMNIPGGVSDTVRRATGTIEITPSDRVVVDALRPLRSNTYAQPAGG
ncbi:DUF881 domain-containing protein [Nakamurella antarctica]|uniref:DUF881 domain-containing protein n=1 Tax=Nakamurella antarctica TaxID=1902245 RepID=A0A3G8ZJW1_9ACTN|nr:DUF881 domain-containing protein [Nakamurella antarctica]AZI57629.1 DUF881 domain-containing protein [Nakamurella antarctica]